MKKLFILLVINFFIIKISSAQKEFDNWFFGSESGLSFGTGVPVFKPGKLISSEGCSSISDKQGNLLFYTNGVTVWDRNGNPMPNGLGLQGDVESTQTALITNHPGNDSIYYIFTVAKEGELNGLQYSMVNIRLNGGLGDIIPGQKNIAFNLPVCEKLLAVRHRNKNDIWVITRRYDSDEFVEYLINCSGLIAFPRFFKIGPFINSPNNTQGYLKASPDGKKLAMANFSGDFELFDFDDATGVISNAQTISSNPGVLCGPYGVEFSPDSKLLYVTEAYTCSTPFTYVISQFKLDTTNIAASRRDIDVGGANVAGALQLAPDNKIYISYRGESFVGAITNANVYGTGCTLVKQYVNLPAPAFALSGLPNTAAAYDKTLLGKDTVICDGTSLVIKLNLPNTTYEWKGGSVLDSIVITAAGQYWIKVTHITCVYYDTINVAVKAPPIVRLGNDTAICENKFPFLLEDSIPGASYLWQDSSSSPAFSAPGAGTYWLKTMLNGCSGLDSINISANPLTPFNLGADTTVCSNTPLTLTANVTSASYLWNTGSKAKSIIPDSSGIYWCEAINPAGCSYRDSIRVTVKPAPVVNIGKDTAMCQNRFPLRFAQSIPNATYLWQDGSTDSSFSVPGAGVYWMEATVNGCSTSDSVAILEKAVDIFSLGSDSLLCGSPPITLTVTPPALTRYLWNTGTTSKSILAGTSGIYWCEATNANGCSYRDSIQLTFKPKPAVNIGKDTALCQNKFPLRLAHSIANATYLWQDGSSDSTFSVSTGGLFWLEATVGGCSTRDSILVTSRTVDAFSLGADSIICSRQPLTLTVTPAFSRYLWSSGSTSPSISVNSTGLYWCEAVNANGCSYRDSIQLTFKLKPTVDIGKDTALCQNKFPLRLAHSITNATYLWQDGSIDSAFSVSTGGLYWLEATIDGCSTRDSILVTSRTVDAFSLGADSLICSPQPLILTVTPAFNRYLWSTGSTSQSISVNSTGLYWCEATNASGCSYRDTINLSFNSASAVILGKDTALCQDKLPIVIGQNISNATYLWQDGTTNALYSVRSPGLYWVQATVNGCSIRDSVNITVGNTVAFDLGPDTANCANQPVKLTLNQSFSKYIWNTGNTTNSINVSNPGLYWLEATTNFGCTYRDTINVSFKPAPIVNLGKDTSLCQDKLPLLIGETIPGASYKWQDNSTNPFYSVSQPGVYWMEATLNGCSARDSISVSTSNSTAFNLGADTVLCSAQPLRLQVNGSFNNYRWSTGNNTSSISVNNSGDYWVEAANVTGCIYRDSIRVSFKSPPVFSLGNDTIVCNTSYLLDVNNMGDNYKWQDNSTQPQYLVSKSGSYHVTVSKNGCSKTDTITVILKAKSVPDLGVDRELCAGEELILNPEVTGTRTTWQDGSTNPLFRITAPGRYSVQVENECGTGIDEVVITNGSCKLMVPNAFTPNKRINNTFRLLNAYGLKDFKLQVFNRWGQQVYQTSISSDGWDGRHKGLEQPSGIYVYIISYSDTLTGNNITQKGTVTLIR